MAYDLLIKGGKIIDGSGMPAFHGDVGATDGRIVEIGELSGPAKETINADGLAVTPGFIDNHSHFDAQVIWDPLCTYSCYHGVTTVLSGNCSLNLAPTREEDRDLMLQMLSRVEAIPIDALRTGVEFSWGSFGQYLDVLDRRLGINVAPMVGHSAVRRYVMGDEASERPEATPAEIDAMQALVRESVQAGAVGVSFNRNQGHRDLSGRHIPGVIAPVEELVQVASALKGLETGIVQCGAAHADEIEGRMCTRFSQVSGRPVVYNQIIHRWTAPDHWKMHLEVVEERIRDGFRVYPLINPRFHLTRFNMKNAQVFDRLPTWLPIMRGTVEDKIAAFKNTELRKQL
jgi:N-acyl-D-aspartate/D-glutamate deacylase